MNKINLKGVTAEAVTGILVLVVALINAVFKIFGFDILPIENDNISNIVSGVFVIAAALYNTWKNRNLTSAAQEAQLISDALKSGALLMEDVQALMSKIKK